MNSTHRFLPRNAGRAYPDRRLPLSRFIMSGQLSRLDRSHHRRDARKCIVDLSDVTLIDDQGEKALRAMRRAGAEFIVCGVYTRHLIELIENQCKCR